jgi:hypothetical protein
VDVVGELTDTLLRNADVRRPRPKPTEERRGVEGGDGYKEYGWDSGARRPREPPGSAADDQRRPSCSGSFASIDEELGPTCSMSGLMGALGNTVRNGRRLPRRERSAITNSEVLDEGSDSWIWGTGGGRDGR